MVVPIYFFNTQGRSKEACSKSKADLAYTANSANWNYKARLLKREGGPWSNSPFQGLCLHPGNPCQKGL